MLIDKIAWIEIKNKKILSTRSRGKSIFYIPGGKREPGESDHETLIREIKEELNVNITTNSIAYVGTFQAQAHGHASGIEVKMQCYTARYTGDLAASSEIEEMAWLTYKDYEKISPVDKIIFDWLKEKHFIH